MSSIKYKERVRHALQAMPRMTADEFYSQMSRSMGTPLKYMKYKSVEELKKHILSEIEDGDIFEEYLFKKYPRLFPTDENGELLPQSQRCWNDCPVGWMNIVDSLFGCIDDYVQNHVHTKPNPKYRIRLAIRRFWWKHLQTPLSNFFTPWKKYKHIINDKNGVLTDEQREEIKKSWRNKIIKLIRFFDQKILNKKDLYIQYKCPSVTIDQYKEKFATLRIYYSGGDDEVSGMIRYAEHLSSLTCQYTGKAGKMYKRGMWYATLSPEEAEKIGYKPVEE